MLVAWMVYGTIVGIVLAGGALLLERVLRSFARGGRRVWLVAMVATVAVPVVAWLGLGVGSSEFAAESFRNAGTVLSVTDGTNPGAILLSGLLGFGWATGSALLLYTLFSRIRRVHRGRSEWEEAEVEGTPVLLSDDGGPAVVGFVRSSIVVPRWIRHAESSVARLIIAHEAEHLRGRDPLLLLTGLLLVTAMPWNLALWWMLRRMRLAVEVDCDDRVLGRGEWDVRTYGTVLLQVGEHRSRPGYSLAGFSFPRSTLEERILAMTRKGKRSGAALSTLLLILAAGLLFAALSLPSPSTLAHWSHTGYWCPPATKATEVQDELLRRQVQDEAKPEGLGVSASAWVRGA